MENLLQIKNLTVHYNMETSVVEAVNDISLDIKRGETLGLVGETGAGKQLLLSRSWGCFRKPVPRSSAARSS